MVDINNVLLLSGYGGASLPRGERPREVIWIPRPSRRTKNFRGEDEKLDSGEDLVALVRETEGKVNDE